MLPRGTLDILIATGYALIALDLQLLLAHKATVLTLRVWHDVLELHIRLHLAFSFHAASRSLALLDPSLE